jgi:hypothetical protein
LTFGGRCGHRIEQPGDGVQFAAAGQHMRADGLGLLGERRDRPVQALTSRDEIGGADPLDGGHRADDRDAEQPLDVVDEPVAAGLDGRRELLPPGVVVTLSTTYTVRPGCYTQVGPATSLFPPRTASRSTVRSTLGVTPRRRFAGVTAVDEAGRYAATLAAANAAIQAARSRASAVA